MKHLDPRLERIRLYQGKIKDLTDFVDDLAKKTQQAQQTGQPELKDKQ